MSFNNSSSYNYNREQNYVLDRKLVSVHSEDRDITKWKNSNTFEIMISSVSNVQSLRLIQATMPGFYYTFSNDYQNTKFNFTVGETTYNVTINEGYYTPEQLALELKTKMNTIYGVDNNFNVIYNEIKHTFVFFHDTVTFSFDFSKKIDYDITNCDQPIVWNNYIKWGLPYNLGFKKETYTSSTNVNGIFDYKNVDTTDLTQFIESPISFDINGENCIYMEIDKYNSYDELYPYNKSSTNIYGNNAYDGKINSAFAKIPIRSNTDYSHDSRTHYLHNLVHYEPPIERITRLKFKFRFHDGRLVDFQNFPFDFTIELNSLKNEIDKKSNIRIPATYII